MKEKISIILPTYNESENIINLIEKIIHNLSDKFDYEIIVVDDNSPDGTILKVKEKFDTEKIIPILRTDDFGFAKSIRVGIEKSNGEFVVVMDSDYTHDPVEIPKMIKVAKIYDLVSCSRFCAGGRMQDKKHYIYSMCYNWFLRLLINTQVQDNLGGYFAIRRDKLKELPFDEIFYGYGDYYFRFLHFCQLAKYSILEIPALYLLRQSGKSKSKWLSMIFSYTKEAILLKIKSKQFNKKYFKL